MISYIEALELIERHANILSSEIIHSLDSLGRISSQDMYSKSPLPNFDNSAMDGFALRSCETNTASADNPIRFSVSEVLQAQPTSLTNAAAQTCCSEIMTGAAIPLGYDAVVQIEAVTEHLIDGKRYIEITSPLGINTNIRFSGEDVALNTLILRRGQQIGASEVMLLAALGVVEIEVFKTIDIAVATSGEEISDDYATQLRYGEIYNSNAPLLLNMSASACFNSYYYGVLRDNAQTLIDFIANTTAQVLITTGAVSKGKWDFIPETLRQLGAKIVFHSVAMRPGKPVLFAILPDGRYFFGLPGNPVSAMVGWRFFAMPLFRKILAKEREQAIRVKLAQPFKKKHSLRQFLKANLVIQDGYALAQISNEQESFKIKALTTNNIWAVALEEQFQLSENDLIEAFPLYGDFIS